MEITFSVSTEMIFLASFQCVIDRESLEFSQHVSRRVQYGTGVGADLLLSKINRSGSGYGNLLHLSIKDLIFYTHTECYCHQ